MAPRKQKAPEPQPKAPLILRHPTVVGGSKDTVLDTTQKRKYARIEILNPDGTLKALLYDTDKNAKVTNVGSGTMNYVFAILNASLSGIGSSPDGSALFVMDNWKAISGYWGPQFESYLIRVTPAGRAGTSKYVGTIKDFVALCTSRANIVKQSLSQFGVAKSIARAQTQKEESAPEVTF